MYGKFYCLLRQIVISITNPTFFQNTYSDQIFCRFRTGWTIMFAFCTKKREKANINENFETLILASFARNCNFHHKSYFSSKTLIVTKSFADSELVGLVCLRFGPKTEKKQTLTKTLRLVRKILLSSTANCNFHHKPNFSSKILILTKSFADSELVGLVCSRFAPKSEKKQTSTKNLRRTENLRDMYGKLQFPPQFQLFFQNTYSDQIFCRFKTGWTSMFAFCAKNREKANINEIIETSTENFSVLYGKM